MTSFSDSEPMSLEELDEFLMSDSVPDDCMVLSELDGFLTAVAIGPELIPPSEWLPCVWGEEGLTFESEEQAKGAIGTILGRYNEILDTLANEPEDFDPIVWVVKDTGEEIAADWAGGFMEGMALRPESWQALVNAEESVALAPILVFAPGADDAIADAPDGDEDAENIREKAADLIPVCIPVIYDFFKRTRAHFKGGTKLGRNDPCFCGSGKKFKKCCGAGRV
ncbi:MAG: UPF0149 family protein [Kiloniellales bacterium]|nr:UPF0149 family protein [Kiloniellales bacterium]